MNLLNTKPAIITSNGGNRLSLGGGYDSSFHKMESFSQKISSPRFGASNQNRTFYTSKRQVGSIRGKTARAGSVNVTKKKSLRKDGRLGPTKTTRFTEFRYENQKGNLFKN